MRILAGLILFCVTTSFGQSIPPRDSAFVRLVEGLPSQEPFDTANSYRRVKQEFVYIISDKDLYDLFDYATAVSNYKFNFTDYHILGKRDCRHCLEYCRHYEGNSACHRNACTDDWVWLMRENNKAFTEIPSKVAAGHVAAVYPGKFKDFFRDTLQRSLIDTALHNWYTTGGGDCFARFEYKVLKDRFYPTLILKEWNYWGGCRSGRHVDFTISFQLAQGISQYAKHTILADKFRPVD